MALDKAIKDQLTQYLAMLESEVVFAATLGEDDSSTKVREFLEEIAEMSPKITIPVSYTHLTLPTTPYV